MGSATTRSFFVQNADQYACEGSTVEFSANFPSGWQYSFAHNSVTLKPGQVTSNSITYTSPNINSTSIQVELQVEDSKVNQHSASLSFALR
jgi:cytochrome c oxidase assembly protein Cox11